MVNHSGMFEDAFLTRRDLLCRCGMGFGALALSDLMSQAGLLAAEDTTSGSTIVPPRH